MNTMNLKDAREHYYTLSGILSNSVRQFAFAGIAIIWIFKIQRDTNFIELPTILIVAAFVIVLVLASDLLQYASSSLLWSAFSRIKEKEIVQKGIDDNFLAPKWINWPANVFFWTKTVMIILAYFLILWHLGSVIHCGK